MGHPKIIKVYKWAMRSTAQLQVCRWIKYFYILEPLSIPLGTQNIENYHVPPEDLPEPERLYDVPFPRNPKFYGRDSLIEELHNRLSPSGSTFERKQRSCLVHGIGGMGKTQFALEYTYRYQPSYDFIFWMHAETNPQLALDMIRISASLHLPQRENTSDNAKIEMVRTWFENTGRKLTNYYACTFFSRLQTKNGSSFSITLRTPGA